MIKKILSKPFVARVIDLIRPDGFQKARIKITFYYLFVIFLLLNIFVLALYNVLSSESQNYQHNLNTYIKKQQTIFVDDKTNITIISVQPQIQNIDTNEFLHLHNIFVEVIEN